MSVQKTLKASASVTANGQITDLELPGDGPAVFYLDITAASGTTPTLDVVIEERDPASGKYFELNSFAQKTGVASERLPAPSLPNRLIRARWTLGGTAPNFTFSIGVAVH